MKLVWNNWIVFMVWVVLGTGGIALVWFPAQAPGWVLAGLATTAWPWVVARRGARGTALGSAVAWGALALALGGVAQVVGWREPYASGRSGAGQWAYLSVLATLAALISVFNARRP